MITLPQVLRKLFALLMVAVIACLLYSTWGPRCPRRAMDPVVG